MRGEGKAQEGRGEKETEGSADKGGGARRQRKWKEKQVTESVVEQRRGKERK